MHKALGEIQAGDMEGFTSELMAAKEGTVEIKATKPAHYILMLDSSTSMNGEPWTQVTEAVKAFLGSIANQKDGSHVSVITYSQDA